MPALSLNDALLADKGLKLKNGCISKSKITCYPNRAEILTSGTVASLFTLIYNSAYSLIDFHLKSTISNTLHLNVVESTLI